MFHDVEDAFVAKRAGVPQRDHNGVRDFRVRPANQNRPFLERTVVLKEIPVGSDVIRVTRGYRGNDVYYDIRVWSLWVWDYATQRKEKRPELSPTTKGIQFPQGQMEHYLSALEIVAEDIEKNAEKDGREGPGTVR